MEWITIILLVIGFFILVYASEPKSVLKKRKTWDRGFFDELEEECMHGNDYHYCADCRT